MNKKPFNETKFGQFMAKVADKAGDALPDLANVVQTALTNPALAIAKVGQLLLGKKDENPEFEALHEEFEKSRRDYEMELLNFDLKVFEAETTDRQRASNMYGGSSKDLVDRIATEIMKWNHWQAVGIVTLNIPLYFGAKYFELEAAIVIAGGNMLGMLVQKLMDERRTVVEYTMGASFTRETASKT